MTNTQNILAKIQVWSEKHDRPVTKRDLIDQETPENNVIKGLGELTKRGIIRHTVRGFGYVLVYGNTHPERYVTNLTHFRPGMPKDSSQGES